MLLDLFRPRFRIVRFGTRTGSISLSASRSTQNPGRLVPPFSFVFGSSNERRVQRLIGQKECANVLQSFTNFDFDKWLQIRLAFVQ